MDLQDTLKEHVKELENQPRTLEAVVSVCRCIMATLYDRYLPEAAAHRRGPTSRCPDSDILTLAWLAERESVEYGFDTASEPCGFCEKEIHDLLG